MSAKSKHVGLGLALTATLSAAYFAPPADDDSQVSPSSRTVAIANRDKSSLAQVASASNASTARAHAEVLSIRPRDQDDQGDASRVFASVGPQSKAPAVAQAAPPPVPEEAPQAPPLPFKVLGRYVEDGQTVVFLAHNEQNLVVRVGDTIAQHYRVERMQGSVLHLLYLPLNQAQTLHLGSSDPE